MWDLCIYVLEVLRNSPDVFIQDYTISIKMFFTQASINLSARQRVVKAASKTVL